jgi:hypothetical protein
MAGHNRYRREGCTLDWCGEWHGGEVELCDDCRKQWERTYPQGWSYYPGDCCRHGTYVGGCGIDHMCGACEGGY